MTSILVADDHALLRETWALLLSDHPQFSLAGTCASGEEAVEAARQLQPGIIVLDIQMPGMSGTQAAERILKESPSARILMVSMFTRAVYARKLFRLGVMGYVAKASGRSELMQALGSLVRGEKYLCPEMRKALVQQTFH